MYTCNKKPSFQRQTEFFFLLFIRYPLGIIIGSVRIVSENRQLTGCWGRFLSKAILETTELAFISTGCAGPTTLRFRLVAEHGD